jgi:RNA polymerase sigma-70 factor (ECF subfamily)
LSLDRGKSDGTFVLFGKGRDLLRKKIDADAVNRVQAGELNAFAELYDRYARLVRCLSFEGTGNLNDANDLCQEVFMKAYRQLSELHDPGSFGFWLTGITRNVIVDWQRRKTREKARLVDADLEDHEGHIAERQAAQSKSTELRAMIRELPEAERMALHLFYLDEQPAESARQILKLSPSGFYKVLARARDLLAEKLKNSEIANGE